MGSELVRFATVMTGVHAAARAFGNVSGQQRVGRGGLPPGGPALGVSAGEAPLVLAPDRAVQLQITVSPPERGYWGEVLTTAAEHRGITGLVIDGGVRDVAALEAHRFPVFSALIALKGAAKIAGGEVGGTATVGDVEGATGDWVVCDRDGVTVVAASQLEEIIKRGRARADKERDMFSKLSSGSTTVELLGLDVSTVRKPR